MHSLYAVGAVAAIAIIIIMIIIIVCAVVVAIKIHRKIDFRRSVRKVKSSYLLFEVMLACLGKVNYA